MKMKKVFVKIMVCCISVIALTLFAVISVSANEAGDALKDLYGNLPKEITDELPEDIEDDIEQSNNEAVTDKLDAKYIFDNIGGNFAKSINELSGSFFSLLGTVILISVIKNIGGSIGGSTESVMSYAGGIIVTLQIINIIYPLWYSMKDTLLLLGTIIKTALPAMTCIFAVSGNITASAVNATWLTLLITLLEQICESILIPIFCICTGLISFNSLSSLTEVTGLGEFIKSVKKILIFLLTLITAVFIAIMSYQTLIAQGTDTMTVRNLKFAAGNAIPIIGGALGEAVGTYLTSISIIKGTAGALTAVSVIIAVLPIIIKLTVCRFGLAVVGFTAGLFGCPKETVIIKEAGEMLSFAVALLSVCSVMFVIVIGIFAKTGINI